MFKIEYYYNNYNSNNNVQGIYISVVWPLCIIKNISHVSLQNTFINYYFLKLILFFSFYYKAFLFLKYNEEFRG